MLYKTYRLNDGRKLIVRHDYKGEPATWSVEGDPRTRRITTEAALLLLGRIISAGEIVPQRVRTQLEIHGPIPQITPQYILDQILNPPQE